MPSIRPIRVLARCKPRLRTARRFQLGDLIGEFRAPVSTACGSDASPGAGPSASRCSFSVASRGSGLPCARSEIRPAIPQPLARSCSSAALDARPSSMRFRRAIAWPAMRMYWLSEIPTDASCARRPLPKTARRRRRETDQSARPRACMARTMQHLAREVLFVQEFRINSFD